MQEILTAYQKKLTQLNDQTQILEKKNLKFSNIRLGVFALIVLMIATIWVTNPSLLALVLIPVAIFVILLRKHQALLSNLESCRARLAFYQQGEARLTDQWQGKGRQGEAFVDAEHLYSYDLDLFGEASLFEYLCTCPSALGSGRLAEYLLEENSIETLQERQKIIQELSANEELRDRVSTFCADEESASAEESVDLSLETRSLPLFFIKLYSPVAMLASFVLFSMWLIQALSLIPLLGLFVLGVLINTHFAKKAQAIQEGVQGKARSLAVLSHSLKCLEESQEPSLEPLRQNLARGGQKAYQQIDELCRIIESLEQLQNNSAMPFFSALYLLKLKESAKLEKWRVDFGANWPIWRSAVADFEALIALATFAYEHPAYSYPTFSEQKTYQALELGHPLLPSDQVKCNDLKLDEQNSLLLISGSNMAGKSTFLRSVGINAVLAQAGAPVFAKSLKLSLFRFACSIKISDSLQKGISHFYAEVLRLKKIVELAEESQRPVLYFFDEILHGTNSHDRCVAAEGIVRLLMKDQAVGLVTTHDLTLAQIVDDFPEKARNVHFSEESRDGKMHFDYQMKEGIAGKGNAVELIRSQGIKI